MDNEKVVIPLEMDAKTVKMLAFELNAMQSSELSIFIEEVLNKTNEVTSKMRSSINRIMEENPFSQSFLRK